MTTRRYADRTRVPERQSRSDIEGELERHHCDQIAVLNEACAIYFAWTKGGRMYRMGVDLPASGKNSDNQERRRRLRTLFLYVKARLNAVEDGIKSFDEEFLPETVMGDGRTCAEHAHEQITALPSGAAPSRLALPGGGA